MASRILQLISCTLYFFLLITLTIIGLASLIVGAVGVGLFIPASITYDAYQNTTCLIVDVEDRSCEDSRYYIMWSVEYYISNGTSSQYIFSIITETYDTSAEVSKKIAVYTDRSNHTCYYDKRQLVRVQWKAPVSPRPYLIMIVVGFSCTGCYLVFMGIFCYYRSYQ